MKYYIVMTDTLTPLIKPDIIVKKTLLHYKLMTFISML